MVKCWNVAEKGRTGRHGWIFLDAQTYNAQTNVARLTLPRDSGHSKPNYGLLTHWLLAPNTLFGQLKPKGLINTWYPTHFWTPDAQEFDRHLTPGLTTPRHLTPNFILDTWRPDMWRPNTFWTPDARTYDAWEVFGHLTPWHATTPEQFLDTWCPPDMWPPNSSYSTQILKYKGHLMQILCLLHTQPHCNIVEDVTLFVWYMKLHIEKFKSRCAKVLRT